MQNHAGPTPSELAAAKRVMQGQAETIMRSLENQAHLMALKSSPAYRAEFEAEEQKKRQLDTKTRSVLKSKGYKLEKSRSRDDSDPTWQRYRIVNPCNNTVVEGASPHAFSLSLNEAAEIAEDLEKNWHLT